ncbi:MAG: hypothetical protein ABSH41_23510 [Syntrophobacteraceae bacterium]
MARKKKPADPLNELLEAAKPETLINLIAHLSKFRPDIRRECFDYLKKLVTLNAEQQIRSESEIAMALWWELCPDLEELDTYGGGDDATVEHVAGPSRIFSKNLPANKLMRGFAGSCSTK